VAVAPAPPELVEVTFGERGDRLVFLLPSPAWKRVEDRAFRGFLYAEGERTLRVSFVFREEDLEPALAAARADPPVEVRSRPVGAGWPSVVAVVTYRGAPDAPMLEAFLRSFRLERR
jgi:hypothetical protein